MLRGVPVHDKEEVNVAAAVFETKVVNFVMLFSQMVYMLVLRL